MPDLASQRRSDLARPDDGCVADLELRPRGEIDVDVRLAHATRQLERGLRACPANLVAGPGHRQRSGARLQRDLTVGDALVPGRETGKTGREQRRKQHARDQRHAADRLTGHDRLVADEGKDGEHGRREQDEATARRPGLCRVARLGEPPHTRAEGCRPPRQLRREQRG